MKTILLVTMTDLSKRSDTLGYPALVPASTDGRRYLHNQRLGKILPRDTGEIYSRYVYYVMCSAEYRHEVLASATGTTVKHTSPDRIKQFRFSLPPLPEQRAIAHVLGTLDDKIELNRRVNGTLEAMARALFKSWFVDFDPVRAKAEGRDSGLPRPLADLFPDSLVDSGLGEIPEGWEVGRLGDVAEHPRRGVQPADIAPDVPYIALRHMPETLHRAFLTGASAKDSKANKFWFKKGEILYGKLRPYFHKVGVAPVDGVCSTDIVVVAPHHPDLFAFVLCLVSSDEFVDYTSAGSTGTKMPRTSWADMARFELVRPPRPIAKVFTQLMRPTAERIIAGTHESRSLAALRDTLLPKLISGELRVVDAERFIGRAV